MDKEIIVEKRGVKGQVSVELLAIISLMLAIFVPVILLTYFKSVQISTSITSIQGGEVCDRIASTASIVWHSGRGSVVKIRVTIPQKIEKITTRTYSTKGSEIIATINTGKNEKSEVVSVVDGPVIIDVNSGTLYPGTYTLVFTNDGTSVHIGIGK